MLSCSAFQPLPHPLASDSADPASEPSPARFETVQAPQQLADTASSSAAKLAPAPAPVGNLHQGDVNWLLDERLDAARVRLHAGLLIIAGITMHIAELEAM